MNANKIKQPNHNFVNELYDKFAFVSQKKKTNYRCIPCDKIVAN